MLVVEIFVQFNHSQPYITNDILINHNAYSHYYIICTVNASQTLHVSYMYTICTIKVLYRVK